MGGNKRLFFMVSIVILPSLIVGIQPLCPKELYAFITWEIITIGDRIIKNQGHDDGHILIAVTAFEMSLWQHRPLGKCSMLRRISYGISFFHSTRHKQVILWEYLKIESKVTYTLFKQWRKKCTLKDPNLKFV